MNFLSYYSFYVAILVTIFFHWLGGEISTEVLTNIITNETSNDDSYGLALLSIKIGIAVGTVAVALLIGVLGVICYHNKVIRPRTEVMPLNNRHPTTYVQDIYLPNDVVAFRDAQHLEGTVHPGGVPEEDGYLWARRVIRIPRTAPPYEAKANN